MFELAGILKDMWWQSVSWQDLSQSGKLGFVVAGALACLGGVVTMASLTFLLGSGQLGMLWATNYGGKNCDQIASAAGDESLGFGQDESAEDDNANQIVVDVSGAVNSPGVYELPTGARLGHALELAGGLASDVDARIIAHDLNLAAVLQDGQKIYIPFRGELMSQIGSNELILKVVATQSGELVSINRASKVELMKLDGIGESRAEAIIAGRPYTSIDQLVSEGALTAGVLANIQPQIKL